MRDFCIYFSNYISFFLYDVWCNIRFSLGLLCRIFATDCFRFLFCFFCFFSLVFAFDLVENIRISWAANVWSIDMEFLIKSTQKNIHQQNLISIFIVHFRHIKKPYIYDLHQHVNSLDIYLLKWIGWRNEWNQWFEIASWSANILQSPVQSLFLSPNETFSASDGPNWWARP